MEKAIGGIQRMIHVDVSTASKPYLNTRLPAHAENSTPAQKAPTILNILRLRAFLYSLGVGTLIFTGSG